MQLEHLLRECVTWSNVLVGVAGCAGAAWFLVRSRWAIVLMWGFGIEAAVGVFQQVVVRVLNNTSDAADAIGFVGSIFVLTSAVSAAARLAIMAGAVGALREGSRSSTSQLT